MEKQQHTPGPWGWSHREIHSGDYSTQVYDANEKEIATIAWYPVRQNNITTTSREANARLIAAAPDLLEALEMCTKAMASVLPDFNPYDQAAYDKARAAIAKATGGLKP